MFCYSSHGLSFGEKFNPTKKKLLNKFKISLWALQGSSNIWENSERIREDMIISLKPQKTTISCSLGWLPSVTV